MGEVITMWDGSIQSILSIDDFLELVDEYMGTDSKSYLEEYIGELEEVIADEVYAS